MPHTLVCIPDTLYHPAHIQPTNRAAAITQLIQTLRPDQAEQFLRYLQLNANRLTALPYFSSTSTAAPYHQLPANNLPRTTATIPAPHLAGQSLSSTSTVPPTPPNSTDEASTHKVPSEKVLGKRRARSNSAVEGENEGPPKKLNNRNIAKSKATRVLSGMDQPPTPSSTVAVSGATLSPMENIPAGPESTALNPSSTSDEAPPTKRPRKQRKTKSSTLEADNTVSGIRSMQTVFRASATSTPPINGAPAPAKYSFPIEEFMQPHPSHVLHGVVPPVGGQNAIAPTQTDGTLSLQRPQLQSQSGSSSHLQPRKRLPPLAMDSQAMYRIKLAARAVAQTGDLRALYPLMGYRLVQELLKHLLHTAIRKEWVVRRRDRNMGLDFESSITESSGEPSSQVSNTPGPTPQAGFRRGTDNNMANVRISQNARLAVDHFTVGQSQMRMTPQDVGGSYATGIPSANPTINGYAPTPQPAVDTYQMSQNAETSFFTAFDDGGLSMAGPTFHGGGIQHEVEGRQSMADAHSMVYQNPSVSAHDGNGVNGAQPFNLTYNPYDFSGITWDNTIPQMASSAAQVGTLPQNQGSMDPVSRVGLEANSEENECTAITSATSDQDLTPLGPSKKDSPDPDEVDFFDVAGNETCNSGESAADDSGLNDTIQSTNTHDEGQGLESFVPTPGHPDPQSINQALYGDPESSLDTLPFHASFGSNAEFLQTLFPATEQQEAGSFVTQSPEASLAQSTFEMEDFFNFDLVDEH
jgi:hypothetical protein